MTWIRDTNRSVRDNIVENIKYRFSEMQSGVNGYSTTWDQVIRGPLPSAADLLGNALSLVDDRENKKHEIGYFRCTCSLQIEFAFRCRIGDDPLTEANRLLVDVQRAVSSDIQAGGLALNMVETGNDLDVDGPADSVVSGTVYYDVDYRHRRDDPRKLVGE